MLDTVARTAGLVIGGVFAVAARVRPAIRPLHPTGEVCSGTLTRHGSRRPTGVAWLDEPGTDPVTVRLSNSAGLPGRLPDVRGLAVRVPVGPAQLVGPAQRVGPARFADLLFASTGTRPLTRHLLVVTTARRPPMTTQLPFRSPGGPILIGAFAQGSAAGGEAADESFALGCADLRGPWQQFATLTIPGRSVRPGTDDPSLRFDPVRNTLPGLPNYGWVARLRDPAYAAARRVSPAAAAG